MTDGHRLDREIRAFILDRRAKKRSERTIEFYLNELGYFTDFLDNEGIKTVEGISSRTITEYLLELGERRNTGGIHASYRAIKAFMKWWEKDVEPDWKTNPIDKIDVDPQPKEPIPGIPIEQVQQMVDTCEKNFTGQRDKAILWTLVDSGARRNEFVSLNIQDLNMDTGAVMIHEGKGGKSRTTFIGIKTRREIMRYLRFRRVANPTDPLWVKVNKIDRLSAPGLRQIVRRRAALIGLHEPGLHAFRRTFAIESLRNGCDIYSLMHMMGHTTTSVLQRYLRLVEDDLQRAHELSSPVDNL